MAEDRESSGGESLELTHQLRETLLGMARLSIETYLRKGAPGDSTASDPELEKPGAAFVTLTCKGKLRGCIGYSEPLYPLHETIARCSVAAATQDYRFTPITLEELPEMSISISALSPLQRLESIEDLEPGRHGLLIVGEERRGLLLPQVAGERGWDRETFLRETCRKAGLSAEAWREETVEIFIFEADVFSEKQSEDSAGGTPSPDHQNR